MKKILHIVRKMVFTIFPIFDYFFRWERKLKKWERELADGTADEISVNHRYLKLTQTDLENRLHEEHERGKAIDEKTSKTAFFVGFLTLFVNAIILFGKDELFESSLGTVLIGLFSVILIFNVLCAMHLVIKSMRCERVYGYGTDYLLTKHKDGKMAILDNLLMLENVANLTKVNINRTVSDCLRVCLFCIGFIVTVILAEPLFPFASQFASYMAGKLAGLWDFLGIARYFCL